MENKLKELTLFVDSIAKTESIIQQNQISYQQAQALLRLVDIKGKGFLDLNDIYDLAGKVTEQELFTIFKYMDKQKTGEITLQQFQQALGDSTLTSNNTQKEYLFPRFYAIIDTIKDRPKVLEKAKNQLCLNISQLSSSYNYISNLVQSKYLTNSQICTVLKSQSIKHGLTWSTIHQKIINDLLPSQNVTLQKFIECFSWNKKEEVQEQNLLSGIHDSRQCTPKKQSIIKPVSVLQKRSVSQVKHEEVYQRKTNNFIENKQQMPSFRENAVMKVQGKEGNYRHQFEQIEGNINEVLGSIQQRRQKLRQDSIDRKKLIEDVMNRKRESCGFPQSKGYSSPKQPVWNMKQEPKWNQKQEVNYGSIKNSGPSYLHGSQYTSSKKQNYQLPVKREPLTLQSYSPEQTRQTYPFFNPTQYQPRQPQPASFGLSQSKNKRSSTPLASSSVNYDINQIMKKYNSRTQVHKEDDTNTLKQLCKSKSGYIYNQQPQKYTHKYQNDIEIQTPKWYQEHQDLSRSVKIRGVSKENVLKRAQEEAAKKIEQIERKARMKVLQKKNVFGRKDGREWRPLTKKGTYY